MSFQERNTIAFGIVAVLGYAVYLALVLPALGTTPVAQVQYVIPMLATIGAAIIVGIIAGIVLGMSLAKGGRPVEDERDRRIDHLGERVGNAFIIIGGMAVIALAMLRVDPFWIANAMYLAFVLAALLSTATKLTVYRRGLPTW